MLGIKEWMSLTVEEAVQFTETQRGSDYYAAGLLEECKQVSK